MGTTKMLSMIVMLTMTLNYDLLLAEHLVLHLSLTSHSELWFLYHSRSFYLIF